MSWSGGLFWKYVDSSHLGGEEVGSVLCLIHGRKVIVTEALFGGVVAQPTNSEVSNIHSASKVVDLT